MSDRIKNIGLFIVLLSLVLACQDDDEMQNPNSPCESVALKTISDGENCDDSDFFLICEAVEVTGLISLQDEDFDWIPMLCHNIGETSIGNYWGNFGKV